MKRITKNEREHGRKIQSARGLLRCFGPFDISHGALYYFLKARGQTTKQAQLLVWQTPTRLYFKPPPLSIKPHYIMTRARARAILLFNFLWDNECNPIFPIKKKLLSFFSISEILFRTLNEQPPFRMFVWTRLMKISWKCLFFCFISQFQATNSFFLLFIPFW